MDSLTFCSVFTVFFSTLSCISSTHLIFLHLSHYYEPRIQKYIVRLLWMAPIYCVDAMATLIQPSFKIYIDTFRDCYEAYVLYQFFSLLMAYLGGMEALETLLSLKMPMSHPFPLCYLPKIKLGGEFLAWSRRCILQFVLLKPFLAAATLLLQVKELYAEGDVRMDRGFMYIAIVSNVSITLSLYYLVLFYRATEEDLKPHRPLPKFLCIKSLIFFSFWQGLAILLLVKLRIITSIGVLSGDQVGIYVQSMLISVEMFGLALAHKQIFGYSEFIPQGSLPQQLPLESPSPSLSQNKRKSNVNGSSSSSSTDRRKLSVELDRLPKESSGYLEEREVDQYPFEKTGFIKGLKDVADITDVIDDTLDAIKPVKDRRPKLV